MVDQEESHPVKENSVVAGRAKDLGAVHLADWLHLDPYPLSSFCGDMKIDTEIQGLKIGKRLVRQKIEREDSSTVLPDTIITR